MLRVFWVNLSTVVVHLRECIARHGGRRKRPQSTEEVVADLYTYLEQLNAKCGELEGQAKMCQQRALFHRKLANTAVTEQCKQRELNWGKVYLQDKHRLQNKLDRLLRCMHFIRQQIDSLTCSQVDNIMLDAMRQYNMTAKRLGLPDKSREIEALSGELQERFTEVEELQHLLSETTDSCAVGQLRTVDDDDLMAELSALMEEGDGQQEKPSMDQGTAEASDNSTLVPTSTKKDQGAELRQRVTTVVLAEHEAEMTMKPATDPMAVREEDALLA
jgi:hypothetical protein